MNTDTYVGIASNAALIEHIEITLYGLKVKSDGYTSKIRAIKALRAVASLHGFDLTLKNAKHAVENIEQNPLVISCNRDEASVVRLAVEQWFVTVKPEVIPRYLGEFYTVR